MRNVKLYLLIGLIAFLGIGCQDFLTEKPKVGVTEDLYYLNDDDALASLYGVYDPLQWQQLDGTTWSFRWVYGDIVSDDSEKGGSDITDQPGWAAAENFEANGGTVVFQNEWKKNYQGIFRANLLISKVTGNPKITDPTKKAVIAEAKFLRAFYYFELVRLFGGVPIVTKTVASSESQIPRASVQEVYAQIEKDLKEAVIDLKEKSEQSPSQYGRATKGAAKAYLVKAYIYQQKWTDAEPLAKEIINSGQYKIDTEKYQDVFKLAGEHGPGSIFEINFSGSTNDGWGASGANPTFGKDDGEGNVTNQMTRARGMGNGWGFNIPTDDFVNEFEPNDPRLTASIFREGEAYGDRGILSTKPVDQGGTGFPYIYYTKKYFINKSEEAPNTQEINGPSNERDFRFSDLLLFHAEAAFHKGDEVGAKVSLNAVRARARMGAPNGTLPDVTATGTALLDAIYHERRVELGLEGHRFWDLVRTGRAGQVMRARGKSFIDGKHELFPIPSTEISLSGGSLKQNPGYN
jgi:starch-binding outer membrane protein, SusD/RagB family